jgi:hypothetical protein
MLSSLQKDIGRYNKYWERKKPTTQKRGSSGRGPTRHEDAELNSNPPILRIKVYLYILLFTACCSLKYPLSGNKIPCPFLYIGPIY